MKKPALGKPRVVYEDPYCTVDEIVADFGSFSKEYYVSREGRRAGVLVLRGEEVLLVRQYRLLIDDFSLEIPGGAVDDGETPEAAAIRECYEETGIQCTTVHPLLGYQLALDTRDNPTYLYYCSEFETSHPVPADRSGKESAGYSWIRFSECMSMVFDGRICDSFSIIALLGYHAMLSRSLPRG